MHHPVKTRYGAAFVLALTMASLAVPRAQQPPPPPTPPKPRASGAGRACRSGGARAESARAGRHQYRDRQPGCVLRPGRDPDRVCRADPFQVRVLGRPAPCRLAPR